MPLPHRQSRSFPCRIVAYAGWLIGAALAGCSTWDSSPSQDRSILPPTRMSRDTVVLEMQTVAIPDSTSDEDLAELWSQLDEQHLGRDSRRSRTENGIRCGLLGTQVPDLLRRILDAQSSESEARWESMESLPENSIGHRRLQARAHRRYEIVSSPIRETCVVLTSLDGRLSGQTLHDAQCRYELRTHPLGDGNIRLELTPEIHHGPLEKSWTGSDGAFQPVVGHKKEVFEELKIDTVLRPGEILLLTSTEKPKGLGELFHGGDDGPSSRHPNVLLVRVAQTQLDNLFDEAVIETPIATSERLN